VVARAEKNGKKKNIRSTILRLFSRAVRRPLAVPQQPDVAKACVTTKRATHVLSRRPLDGGRRGRQWDASVRKTTSRSRGLSYTTIPLERVAVLLFGK